VIRPELRAQAKLLGFTPGAAAGVLGFHLASTVFEGIGIGMVLPVFEYLQAGEKVDTLVAKSEMWRYLVEAYRMVGLPVTLAVLLLTSFVCIVVRQGFVYARLIFFARVRFLALARLQTSLFQGYLGVRLSYHERQQTGATLNDLTYQAERAIDYYFYALDFVGFGFLFLVYVALLVAVSAEMAAAAAVLLGATAAAMGGLLRRSRTLGYEAVEARQQLSAFLTERLNLLRLIRLSGAEAAETETMHRLADAQRHRYSETARLQALLSTAVEPTAAGAAILLLYFGVRVAELNLGTLGLFLVVIARLLPIVRQLLQTRQAFATAEGAVQAIIVRHRDLTERAEARGGAAPFPGVPPRIHFQSVEFVYPERDRPALNGIDLKIPACTLTALVGPSGGGKSTLVDLLPRLREPTAGQILLDGVPLTEFSIDDLRGAIAFVPQMPLILNTSALEHIRYGRPSASMEEVVEAARGAGADGFIEALPAGYHTPLGEGGIELSGGQRQRLDLARALLRRAAVLILDEPTSHLDADSERLFRETLLALRGRGEITIIVIGHHLGTVTEADQIVVLIDGRVSECGRHEALLRANGWYARAFRKQAANSEATLSG
jgi:ABC-type multidrug transport system fused ATPase/permease subunit